MLSVAVVLGGIVWLRSSETSQGPGGAPAGRDLVQQYPPGARDVVEEFDVGLLDGGRATDDLLRGGVAVVNVWGSWCGPCRVEAPILAEVSAGYADRVTFLGINVRDNADAARAFEASFGINYPSVHPDDSAPLLLRFGSALATAAVPVTLVLDAEGGVAARVLGAVDASTLRALLDEALAE